MKKNGRVNHGTHWKVKREVGKKKWKMRFFFGAAHKQYPLHTKVI